MNDSTTSINNDRRNASYPFNVLKQRITNFLYCKYPMDYSTYGTGLINGIIFNAKTHLVSEFKDLLIYDDESDFLKRYYTTEEALVRLPKFYEYYAEFSKLYPNYTSLYESKYIYKNIHKKQKMIDLQQEQESILNKRIKIKKIEDNEVFDTIVYRSIINDNEDIALIFDLKHDYGDIGIDIYKIIEEINNFTKDNDDKSSIANCTNNITANNSSMAYDNGQQWKGILTQRPMYCPTKMPIKPIPIKRQTYSAKRISEKSLLEYRRNISYRRNGNNIIKVSNNNNNEKTKYSNTSISFNQKNNHSVSGSFNKPLLPNSNSNVSSSVIVQKQTTPLTQRHSTKIAMNHNDNHKLDPEKIKVNTRRISENDSMKIKKHIMTPIQNGSNTYYFQAKAIADKIKRNLRLGGQPNKAKENGISPPITARKICYNQIKSSTKRNSCNTSKSNSKQNGTPNKINPQVNKKEIEVLRKNRVVSHKQSYSHNTSARSNKASFQEKNKKEIGDKTTRPQSQNNAMKYSNKNEEKKEISTCRISLLSPGVHKSPNTQIKNVKGIHIKEFNKLMSIVEKVTTKPTLKQVSATDRIIYSYQRNHTNNHWRHNDKFNEITKQNS